jgi:NADPH-dependent 2,4-dienoyl-CoA reductase/sulfur reductase-like enzyme
MPYYIGDVIKDQKHLVARTPEEFRKGGIEVSVNTSVVKVDAGERVVHLSDGKVLSYDYLVFATGSKAQRLGIPGEDLEGVFTLKTLADTLRIKAYLAGRSCRKAVIVGGGFIGLEMSEAFRTLGLETTILDVVERPVMRWDPEFSKTVLEELNRHGVSFLGGSRTQAVEKGTAFPLRVVVDQAKLDADVVLMSVGIRPEVELAAAVGIHRGKTGAIEVNSYQQTSKEGVYAVGDCCEVYHRLSKRWVYLPLGDVANKQGRLAGRNIGGNPMIFPGVVGAQSFKIFNLEVAATGLGEKEATDAGYQPVSTIIWGSSIAKIMPGAKKLGIKLVADKTTGQLLGAQSVGENGAVSRINTLSVALWSGMNIDEIANLDLAYSPFFSGPWDTIHVAAQALKKHIQEF